MSTPVIAALAGGVGGARLARGLARIPGMLLTVIVNTGDDFDHFDLRICPDLDTVMYTLAGRANPETGWGLEGDSWNFMAQVAELGGADWFSLGDRDLATHVLRSAMLRRGDTLTAVTRTIATRMGVAATILPMSDSPVRTRIETHAGLLDFQDYFVRRRCDIPLTGIVFDGASDANASDETLRALESARLIVVCPSNPYLSIDPILSVRGIRERLRAGHAPRIAVSPIISGRAVKGPAAKIMAEMGHRVSCVTVAQKFLGLIDGIVIDDEDAHHAGEIEALGLAVRATQTLMRTHENSLFLAHQIVKFANDIRPR